MGEWRREEGERERERERPPSRERERSPSEITSYYLYIERARPKEGVD